MTGVAARLEAVCARVADACDRAGRERSSVTIVGVAKGQPPAAVVAAVAAGLTDIGENRVQEAMSKIAEMRAGNSAPRWHLIGNLQTNKVKAALGLFDIIHTVDSDRLAEAIDRHARQPVPVLLEVNVAGESTKRGFSPLDVPAAARRIGRLSGIDLVGLMTVAPQVGDTEDVRPVFRALRELRDEVGLRELSMGMTDDFEVAVEEGSTLVRVGRAIFGECGSQAIAGAGEA
jgi:pyridoxal phosphate enzyme (YggS family)